MTRAFRTSPSARAPLVAVAMLAASLAASRPALADPTPLDKASAQALFDDALKLMADKSYAAACPKLEESQRLDPGMGTQYRLAECYEAVGRTASAWAGFVEVADLARAAGQRDREKTAHDRAARLEKGLCRLTITAATPEATGLEIRRGDVAVGKGQWGTALPVDPGTYAVTATASGKRPWSGSVTVASDKCQAATLTVPALEDAPAAAVAPPPTPVPPLAPAPASFTPPAPAAPSTPSSAQKVVGIVALGVGVVGLGAGVGVGFLAKSQYDGANDNCRGSVCNASGKQTTDSARGLGNVATGVFVAGALVAAGGLVVWLTAPSSKEKSDRASLALGVGPGTAFLGGSF